ncbi:murein hydrolase activator EnvC [Intestinimonas sp.]|uniref:murein hydrolase activator EnvC family protein n=1 Tax=Intestinimonas sp. TaxID=1965293 RepID=UPI00260E19E8|nr:peptidoglycan DD-metalloendopeptidase family protein [Intestinimonas sp.]
MSEAKRTPKKSPPKRPRRDWHKKVVALLALLMALLMVLPMVTMVLQTAGAVTQEELQAQIDAGKSQVADLNNQIDALGEQLADIQNDKSQALAQKGLLEQQINALNESIGGINATIAQYDQLIAEKEAQVAETQAKEEEQYALFCKRVRVMEEMGRVSYWDILFGASSFSDLLDRATMVSEIMEYDNQIMEDLAATRQALMTQQEGLETSRADQQAQKKELEGQQTALKAKKSEVDTLIESIRADESKLEQAEAALRAEADRIDAQIVRRQRELQALIAAGQISFDPGSGWQWPVPGYYTITSVFGPRIHPITGRPGNHTGTDIAAPGGTKILSARGGVVTISTYNNSYGNYVVVQHDNGISTLYAHMNSRVVSEGDVVTQGQVLGYVGTTGSSTGNHLHLEFRVNGSRTDALTYYPALAGQFIYR